MIRGPLAANAALLAATDWMDRPVLYDVEEVPDGEAAALPRLRVVPELPEAAA